MQGVPPSSQNVSLYPRPTTGGFLKIKSYAKLNLFLDVINRRADGYHNIVSVMQSVDLYDELEIKTTENPGFSFVTDSDEVPKDESNLVVKAAKIMISRYGIKEPFEIRLKKNIPVGAGLGGGSGNCASVLHGINVFFNLNIPHDELLGIGRSLGADVPFCLTGGTCLAEGIGEKLTPLDPHPDCLIVIAYPNTQVSTKEIFASLAPPDFSLGEKNLEHICSGLSNNELTKVALSLYNVFTDLTVKKVPRAGQLLTVFRNGGAIGESMTGTGSAVFGYFTKSETAQSTAEDLKRLGSVFITRPVKGINVRR